MTAWRSLEARLALWYSGVGFMTFVAFSVALWFGVRYAVVAATDDLLRERLSHLVEYVTAEADGPEVYYVEEELIEYARAVPGRHLPRFTAWTERASFLSDRRRCRRFRGPIPSATEVFRRSRFHGLRIGGLSSV